MYSVTERAERRASTSQHEQYPRGAPQSDGRKDAYAAGNNMIDSASDRPETVRSTTDPTPAMILQDYFAAAPDKSQVHHRNRSPFSRSHLRSRSSGSAMVAPAMVRAHSMPAVHSASRTYDTTAPTRPSGSLSPGVNAHHSPQRSPARNRSPLVAENQEAGYFPPPRSPHWFESANGGPIESIQEDSELDLTPRSSAAFPLVTPPPVTLLSRTGSMRRRPASPLHSVATPTSHPIVADTLESPALAPTKFTEAFPASFSLHHYASTSSFSSISSTPSSARSRSPSISSLDTIEDAPDAEDEAIEADRLWRLQLSEKADRGEDDNTDAYRRKGFGFGRGRNIERKRWSVCGGERRADLDLETIWED